MYYHWGKHIIVLIPISWDPHLASSHPMVQFRPSAPVLVLARPGKEQWHQKLHNNTTPADIGICRAIIAYLRGGGDMGSYWRVLGEHGITKAAESDGNRWE